MLSREQAEEHVGRWERKLSSSRAPYRKWWPRYLFRHEAIENAVRILQTGHLLSRDAATGFTDIAAGDVLDGNHRAHGYSRLYFRPKSPTQYHVEGIKKRQEIWHGAHAPVLVMLVFDSVAVLSADGTSFSNGNMQSPGVEYRGSHEFFETISFEDVFHVGPFSSADKERIIRARCAEVLAHSPLALDGHLRAIVCRSSAERAFLLDRLGQSLSARYGKLIVNHSEPGIFEHSWAYVESVDASPGGLRIKLHPRADLGRCEFDVRIILDSNVVWRGRVNDADLSIVWNVNYALSPGTYRCEIDVEGCLAYSAAHLIDDMPF